MMADDDAPPLRGLRVLELSMARAGPVAARQLADWGAEVIKVEPPAAVEDPSLAAQSWRETSDIQNLTRNRRCITLNLKHPDGIAALRRLAGQADILIENYRPDVKTRLGFDYETLAALNPRLIYASISGFGQDGPYAGRPGVDQILQGMGGLMSINGFPDGPPTRLGIAINDFVSGLLVAFGVMAAVYERQRSGKGQWIRGSLLQTQAFLLDFQAARWLQDGEVAGRAGNNHPLLRPSGLYAAADAPINIAMAGPNMWPRVCSALGLDRLVDDPNFASIEARMANNDQLTAEIEAVTRTREAAHWVEKLNAAGVPCGPVNTIDRVFEDPQAKHLSLVQHVESETLGTQRHVRQPLDFSRTPPRKSAGAPDRGRNTDEVLADFGFGADEVAALRAAGVI